jgi:hypothetical protein
MCVSAWFLQIVVLSVDDSPPRKLYITAYICHLFAFVCIKA